MSSAHFQSKLRKILGTPLGSFSGEKNPQTIVLSSVAKGLFELRDEDNDGWYRIIYLSRTNDIIHVVHAFEKATAKMPDKEKQTARQNFKAVSAYLREERKRGKK